jgi:surfeit locus 1 family protein
MNPPHLETARRSFWRLAMILLAVSTCLGMSVFQLYRASVKTALYDQMLAAQTAAPISLNTLTNQTPLDFSNLDLHQVRLKGKWLVDKTIFLDNKLRNRWVGYHVLTPFQLEASTSVILVNRGWVVAPRLRSELPNVVTSDAPLELSGSLRKFEQRVFELKTEPPAGRVWQHIREDEYRKNSGLSAELSLLPLMLLQTSAADDGLVREWNNPEHPALHHFGYALMWLIFSIMAAVYGWMLWKRQ